MRYHTLEAAGNAVDQRIGELLAGDPTLDGDDVLFDAVVEIAIRCATPELAAELSQARLGWVPGRLYVLGVVS